MKQELKELEELKEQLARLKEFNHKLISAIADLKVENEKFKDNVATCN